MKQAFSNIILGVSSEDYFQIFNLVFAIHYLPINYKETEYTYYIIIYHNFASNNNLRHRLEFLFGNSSGWPILLNPAQSWTSQVIEYLAGLAGPLISTKNLIFTDGLLCPESDCPLL